MTYSREQLREMTLLYLNGILGADERARFEAGLARHPKLQAEVARFAALENVLTGAAASDRFSRTGQNPAGSVRADAEAAPGF